MTTLTKEQALATLKEAFENTTLADHCEAIENAMHYYDGKNDADDFAEWYRETYIDSAEIIYYHTAIEYLKENDPSLRESTELASDIGYDVKDINSELLATLLLQQELNEELAELNSDLVEYFEAIQAIEDANLDKDEE